MLRHYNAMNADPRSANQPPRRPQSVEMLRREARLSPFVISWSTRESRRVQRLEIRMKVEATLSVWVEEFGRRFETPVAKLPPAVMERIQSDQVSVRTRAGWLVWEMLFRQERHDSCQKDLVAAYAGLAQAEAAVQQAGLDAQTAERKHRGALGPIFI